MHLGNYLGAVRRWKDMQTKHECLFPVVDLHALTVPQNPKELRKATLNKVMELIASGLDPERCTLFVQSHVKEHTELAWILQTIAPLGELERMTQYKEKGKTQKSGVNAGLLTYPALMASDILLYQTDAVPVGKDQVQHLEFTRTMARKFNSTFGQTFKEPAALVSSEKEGAKIMSLVDPKKKMSKSDPNPKGRVSPFEDPEHIRRNIMGATTDAGKEIRYSPAKKPGVSNLLVLHSLMSGESIASIEKRFKGKGYAPFKRELAELAVSFSEPLRKKKRELERREAYIQELLKRGARKARSLAEPTIEEVRERVGLLS